MAVEQVRPDQRPEKWFGSRRKILTSAQGLRFFPKPPAALLILLFQSHAMSEMRGCLSTRRENSRIVPDGEPKAYPAKPPGSWPFSRPQFRQREFVGGKTGAAIGTGDKHSLGAAETPS